MVTSTLNLFLDTEFTNFDSLQLISIGIASDDNQEFYAENMNYALEDCTEFVQEIVLPKLTGGKYAMSEAEINAKLSNWLLDLIGSYEQLRIHMDFHADLLILDRLLIAFPAIDKLNCLLINLNHLKDQVNVEERKDREHHALWDAKDLYMRWKLAASGPD